MPWVVAFATASSFVALAFTLIRLPSNDEFARDLAQAGRRRAGLARAVRTTAARRHERPPPGPAS